MNRPDPVQALNRLLQILYRSLPVYLEIAHPWTTNCDQPACDLLGRMAADHRHYAGRIAEAMQEARGCVDYGSFPMAFTGLHDVSLAYLLKRAYELQKRDVACIEQCAAGLSGPHRQLAEEVLGIERKHSERLGELLAKG